ncbi:MAG: serine O-acetyltransferase [Planctomycetes bacterium]|nr:serine O-acetyltransferase [Planctomycetota bacterium]
MLRRLREDVLTVFKKDPAARSVLEVLTCYPGLHAIWAYRIAHWLWVNDLCLAARILSHLARCLTGIEIHPGARIGRRFFIDHGMGIVIGETSDIGDDVLLYQGVVLGGTTFDRVKRHPTLEDEVVVGTGATILGAITIGKDAKVGAGSVVIQPVPPGATVVGVPGHVVQSPDSGVHVPADLEHGRLPDPVVEALNKLSRRIDELEQKLKSKKTRRLRKT